MVEGLLMICADGHLGQCHLIIASISVDYEEQVVLPKIKLGMRCSICQVRPEKRENLCKTWAIRTHKSTWA